MPSLKAKTTLVILLSTNFLSFALGYQTHKGLILPDMARLELLDMRDREYKWFKLKVLVGSGLCLFGVGWVYVGVGRRK